MLGIWMLYSYMDANLMLIFYTQVGISKRNISDSLELVANRYIFLISSTDLFSEKKTVSPSHRYNFFHYLIQRLKIF